MYLSNNSKDFLILLQEDLSVLDPAFGKHIKAIVRKVRLRPFGNFMMENTSIYGHKIVLSGAYGDDGLPVSIPTEIFEKVKTSIPNNLKEKWNKGGGHNNCGREADDMRLWAIEHLKELRR